MRAISLSVAVFMLAGAAGCQTAEDAAEEAEQGLQPGGCFLALIHGSGSDYHHDPAGSANEWMPAGNSALSVPEWVGLGGRNCKFRYIGYAGKESFIQDTEHVAAQLRRFIDEQAIPSKQMIILTHSMGGLVARHLLNSIEPNGPRHRLYGQATRDNFAAIKRATLYAITLQAPHFGSEAADSLYFETSAIGSSIVGMAVRAFTSQEATNARNSMRRQYMEDAVSWMGDSARVIPIYTVAGFSTRGKFSRGHLTYDSVNKDDDDLARASFAMFGIDERYFANDGLVEERSAHGKSVLKENKWHWWPPGFAEEYSSERTMLGAWAPWTSTPLNHNHGRYSDLETRFHDFKSGKEEAFTLSGKLFTHGLGLPCSDPEMKKRLTCR